MGKHLNGSSSPATTTPLSTSPLHHALAESSVEDTMETLQSIMNRWSNEHAVSPSSPSVSSFNYSAYDRREARLFVDTVKDLQSRMQGLVSVDPVSEKLIHAQNLTQTAMRFLEMDFDQILDANREYLDSETVSVISSRTPISSISASDDDDECKFVGTRPDAMDDLKLIADCMISTGYTKECLRVYKKIRRSVVDDMLNRLGVERLSFSQIQKLSSKVLRSKIKTWLRAVDFAMTTLFPGERILCDHVFSGSRSRAESCFAEITQEAALNLFGFSENVAKGKKTTEKMFQTLDMYEAISIRFSEIESIFSSESTSAVRSQAANSLTQLADAVRHIMAEFEQAIEKDASKPPSGGGVHPLTSYIMNYLVFISDYSDSIAAIFADWKHVTPSNQPASFSPGRNDASNDGGRFSSPVSARIKLVIFLTLCKIDGKARRYKDTAKSYLFLANNFHYAASKVRLSKLNLLLGEDWAAAHTAKAKQYAAKYEKAGWGKVIAAIPSNTTTEITAAGLVREILIRFNGEFETACNRQVSWVIPDPELRHEIKVSLAKGIIPIYREFYETYRDRFDAMSIVAYTPDELGNYLCGMFSGTCDSENGPVRLGVQLCWTPDTPNVGR